MTCSSLVPILVEQCLPGPQRYHYALAVLVLLIALLLSALVAVLVYCEYVLILYIKKYWWTLLYIYQVFNLFFSILRWELRL